MEDIVVENIDLILVEEIKNKFIHYARGVYVRTCLTPSRVGGWSMNVRKFNKMSGNLNKHKISKTKFQTKKVFQ